VNRFSEGHNTNGDAKALLADLYLASENKVEAERLGQEALAINPDHPIALYVLAMIAIGKEDYATAIRDLEVAMERLPTDERLRKAFREARMASGQIIDPVKKATSRIADQGESTDATLELADAFLFTGDPESAMTELRKVMGNDPENNKAHFLETLAYVCLSRPADASPSLQLLHPDIDPRYPVMASLLNKDYSQVLVLAEQMKSASETEPWGAYFKGVGLILTDKFDEGVQELDRISRKYETFGQPLYEIGRFYEEIGEPQLALVIYQRRLMELFQESPRPRYHAARTMMGIGHLERAQLLLDETVRLFPNHRPSRFLLGSLLLRKREFSAATGVFEALVQESSKEANVPLFYKGILAKTLVFDHSYEKALEQYNELIQAQPQVAATYIEKCLSQMVLNRLEEALATCDAGLVSATSDQNILQVVRAVVLQQMDRSEEAQTVITAAVNGSQWDPVASERMIPVRMSIAVSAGQYDLARTLIQNSRENPRIIQYCIDSIALAQDGKSDLRRFNLGLLFSFYQWPDAALVIFGEMVQDYPQDKLFLAFLGESQSLAELEEDAYNTYSKAVSLAPDDTYFLERKAVAASRSGRFDEAVSQFLAAITLEPETARLHFQLARLYETQGLVQDAIDRYRVVLTVNPPPGEKIAAHNNLAWLLAENKDTLPEALQNAEAAMELAPENPRTKEKDGNILDTVGWIKFLSGIVDEAQSFIQRALKVLPNNPTITYHLGRIYEEKLETVAAMHLYLKSVDYNPEYPEADDAKMRAARMYEMLSAKKK
jgi:tetratricopeptide (TPR) repeat protein